MEFSSFPDLRHPERALLGIANHLLAGESWAPKRLAPFAGRAARIEFGALTFPFVVTEGGFFATCTDKSPPAVIVCLPNDAPLRALTDRSSLLSTAQISGSADFAEALAFVFRHLRWNAEDDVARLVGDIAARRLVQRGKALLSEQLDKVRRFSANVAEYLSGDAATLAGRKDLERYGVDVGNLQLDLERLEKRLARLEQR